MLTAQQKLLIKMPPLTFYRHDVAPDQVVRRMGAELHMQHTRRQCGRSWMFWFVYLLLRASDRLAILEQCVDFLFALYLICSDILQGILCAHEPNLRSVCKHVQLWRIGLFLAENHLFDLQDAMVMLMPWPRPPI